MVRPDGGIGRRNGLKIRCPKRTCGFDPRSGYHFFEYFGISCALLSPSTRSSTVVHSLATSSAKHNLCSNYFKKTCGFYFFLPRSVSKDWLPCVALPALRYSGSAPLSRLVNPRSGYHFCLWQKMKPAKASLHAAAKRSFIHCSVAAMCFIRRQPCFIFYKPCQMKHCSADAPQYEAAAVLYFV